MYPFHFYLVFNPFMENDNPDTTQAHDFYNALKDKVSRDPMASMFWGKLKSASRKGEIEFEKFKGALEFNIANKQSTHLYISDYEHLWVAKVKSVTTDAPKKTETLEFYSEKECEIWFEITDMDLLDNGHKEAAKSLSHFYIENSDFMIPEVGEIETINPYLSKLRFPLIVQDKEQEEYFDNLATEIEPSTHLVLKSNPLIINKGSARVIDSLISYCFPKKVFDAIPHGARESLVTAELNILDYQNFAGTAFNYLKSLEVILNHLIKKQIHLLKKENEFFVDEGRMSIYTFNKDNSLTPLVDFHKSISIKNLIYFFEINSSKNDELFTRVFKEKAEFVKFVKDGFKKELEKNQLVEIRNILAHDDSALLDHKDAMKVRKLVLGVGCSGLINELYRAYNPKLFSKLTQITGDYRNITKKQAA